MSQSILFLAHVDESGAALPQAAYEALGAALELTAQLGGKLTVGLIGENIQVVANSLAGTSAAILGVSGSDFANPRYASDAAAVAAICVESSPQIVIAPGTSRFMRVIPGVVHRLRGQVDTHLTSIELDEGVVTAERWFYRQRLEAVIQRQARPWFLVLDPGCHRAWSAPQGKAEVQALDVQLTDPARRTAFIGLRTPSSTAQTIRPDANLL